jgi:hypothetical protein
MFWVGSSSSNSLASADPRCDGALVVTTYKPHDATFKAIFEHLDHAIDLFRSVLPAAISDSLDWSTLTLESGAFIDTDLSDCHGDLLFSVQTHDAEPCFLLLEHQSTHDADMPLRVYVYRGRIWKRSRKQSQARLPPVIPVLVSHAPGGWTGPRTLGELLVNPANVDLAAFVPDSAMVVDDLARLSNEQLEARPLSAIPKLALWFLRDARSGSSFRDNLPFWARYFTAALREPPGAQSVDALLNYVTLVCEGFSWDDFHATIHELAPEAEETIMTIAEQLIAKGREKGREEGREQGREEGRIELLSTLLTLKFGSIPPEYHSRLAAAGLEELHIWAERVLFCASIDEVFAGSH